MPPTDHPAAAPAVEPVDLEGIKARHAKASEGPWFQNGDYVQLDTKRREDFSLDQMLCDKGVLAVCRFGKFGDAHFLAHSWADVKALIRAVESRDALAASQAAEIAGLKAEVGRLESHKFRLWVALCEAYADHWTGQLRGDCVTTRQEAREIADRQVDAVLGGLAPSPDPDNPAATEASERQQQAEACRAGEIAKAGEGEEA